jgi:hypothetical protein
MSTSIYLNEGSIGFAYIQIHKYTPVWRTLSDPARSTRLRDATSTAPSASTPARALSLLSTTSLLLHIHKYV